MDYEVVTPEVFEGLLNVELKRHMFYQPGWGVEVKVHPTHLELVPVDGADERVIQEALQALYKSHRTDVTVMPLYP
ncbi:hypothetical protein [Achromobacter spanius]|uniref:hypothetical protein n=1 Tax=Achromobacter spanius TaxID=217203 RepID=UPI00320AFE45